MYSLFQRDIDDDLEMVVKDGIWVFLASGTNKSVGSSLVFPPEPAMTIAVAWLCPAINPNGFLSPQGGITVGGLGQGQFISPWNTTLQDANYFDGTGVNQPQMSWSDGKWRQHTYHLNYSTMKTFESGVKSSEADTVIAPNFSELTIGSSWSADSDYYFVQLRIFSGLKSPVEIFNNYKTGFPTLLMPTSEPFRMVVGDSISTDLYCGIGNCWTRLWNPTGYQAGIVQGGWKLQDMIDNFDRVVDYLATQANSESSIIIFGGTNDLITGKTGAETYALFETLIDLAIDAGFGTIYGITPCPRFETGTPENAAFEPERIDYSDLMVANLSGKLTGIIDVRDIAIGVNGEQDSLDFYVIDHVHLNAAGQAQLAALVEATI